jgi:hypothetical protein
MLFLYWSIINVEQFDWSILHARSELPLMAVCDESAILCKKSGFMIVLLYKALGSKQNLDTVNPQ